MEMLRPSGARAIGPLDSDQPRIAVRHYRDGHVRVLICCLANAHALFNSLQLRASLRERNKTVNNGKSLALIDAMASVYSILQKVCLFDLHFANHAFGVEFWSHLNSRLQLIDFVVMVFVRQVGSRLASSGCDEEKYRTYSERPDSVHATECTPS